MSENVSSDDSRLVKYLRSVFIIVVIIVVFLFTSGGFQTHGFVFIGWLVVSLVIYFMSSVKIEKGLIVFFLTLLAQVVISVLAIVLIELLNNPFRSRIYFFMGVYYTMTMGLLLLFALIYYYSKKNTIPVTY